MSHLNGEVPLLHHRQMYPHVPLMRLYASHDHVLQKFDREAIVEGHNGCVNTVRWSDDGSLLLSGSDDSTLQLYSYPTYRNTHRLHTGHIGIIFGAMFFPQTGNSLIVSGANNGMILVTDVEYPSASSLYNCHRGAVYSVVPTTDNMFYSCGGDRSVREFDLREDSSCNCSEGVCHRNVLIKCKTQSVSSLVFNPVKSHEFCMSLGATIRLYDTRKLRRRRGLFSGEQRQAKVAEYKITDQGDHAMERITYSNYNSRGSEILISTRVGGVLLLSSEKLEPVASLTSDDIPTTSSGDSPNSPSRAKFTKRLRICGDWSDTGPDARPLAQNQDNQTSAERFISQISDRVSSWLSQREIESNDEDEETESESEIDESDGTVSSDSSSSDIRVESEPMEQSPDKENDVSSLHLLSQFTGHRNTRTMIKQANFWGDSHVISGSDCGRIFVWNRHTKKVVHLLIGDSRVVNCIQPHPFDPVLATSGIDHNIKIWSPILDTPRFDQASITKVIECNEQMLAETGDTVTIPTTVMLRVLSMMNSRGGLGAGPIFGGPEPPGPL